MAHRYVIQKLNISLIESENIFIFLLVKPDYHDRATPDLLQPRV